MRRVAAGRAGTMRSSSDGSVPHAVHVIHVHALHVPRARGGGFAHLEFGGDRLAIRELERDRHLLPRLDPRLGLHQHDVIVARGERHAFVRGDGDGIDVHHIRHAVLVDRLVQHDHAVFRAGRADELDLLVGIVGDLGIAARRQVGRKPADPGVGDLDARGAGRAEQPQAERARGQAAPGGAREKSV